MSIPFPEDPDVAIAKFIKASISALRDGDHGHPVSMTPEEWNNVLQEIVEGFDSYVEAQDRLIDPSNPEYATKLARSFQLLADNFTHLWY